MKPKAIERWRAMVAARDYAGVSDLLAEDAVFRSPVVNAPQVGKALTAKYIRSAMRILGNSSFRFTGEWFAECSGVLEFEVEIEGVTINGVDIIQWNDFDQIVGFKVMVRPIKAINLLQEKIAQALQGAV